MKKTKSIRVEPYNYEDDNMPCCVQDSGIDGQISDDLKRLIDERLAAVENGTAKLYTWDEAKQDFELTKQMYRHKQEAEINV